MAIGVPGTTALAQAPCADVLGLLETIDSPGGGTALDYSRGYGAFFPKDSHHDGSRASRESDRCQLVLHQDGAEVGRWRLLINDIGTVFQRFQPFGGSPNHKLTSGGEFTYSLLFNGEPVTKLPFTVTAQKSGDPFNPATTFSVDCDLFRWAQLEVNHAGAQPRAGVEFRLRGSDLDLQKGDDVFVAVEHEGREVYSGGRLGLSGIMGRPAWQKYSKSFTQPKHAGGGFLPLDDFLKVDGTYRIVVKTSDTVLRAWEYVVEGGAIQPHPRSSFEHQPRTDYLLSRVPVEDGAGYRDLYWLEPVADLAAPVRKAAAPVEASASLRAAWKPTVPAPERKPSVVLTDVASRVDSHLAVGDGIVAFGTGANTGVAFLKCGDDVEQSIPGGAEFSSRAFFVCGQKLVLLKRQQVFVYDTATGAMEEIARDDVTLLRAPSSLRKGRHIDTDGMLVAVVCDPTKTADRKTIKVLDLSGASTTIMALGFPDAAPNGLASIAVDAAGGVVVVGSDRKSTLFTAPIAAGASFRGLDLSGHDGLPKDCAPIVRGGQAAVFDSTGTRKLRLVDLDTGAVRAVSPLGQALQNFDFDGSRIALASDQSYGSSYEIRIGAVTGSAAKAPSGAGESSSFGKVGYGQRVALGPNGLVFTSGSGKSGIGRDEVLLVSDGSSWREVMHGDKALPAVDATLGTHVLAFKTGKARDARIGYVLLGAGMDGSGLATR